MNENNAVIEKVAGPLIVASGMRSSQMYDVVRVSEKRLIGEIIELRGDRASIQVYEDTAGLGPGEPVYSTGEPLSVELAPGLIGGIFDGIQRPLERIYEQAGDRIARGVDIPKLDREAKWNFVPVAKPGDKLGPGDVLGTVEETPAVTQKIMVPRGCPAKWPISARANSPSRRRSRPSNLRTAVSRNSACFRNGRFAAGVPLRKSSPRPSR